MKPVAMVGWSGRGRQEDLERTAWHKLGLAQKTERTGDVMIIDSKDTVAVARSLAMLPGVAWVAVGYRFAGNHGYLECLASLAKRYLAKGRSFRISAQAVRSRESPGDLILAGNSKVLAEIDGTRVDERKPLVRFRVSVDGGEGACGVEIVAGPGGTPTGNEWVSCLVSGGANSSSMAWMVALAGFSVRLVHSRVDEASLRMVAKLYSELSFRMDPRRLEVVLLEGHGPPLGRLGIWLRRQNETAFAGLRPQSASAISDLAAAFPNLVLPMLLFQEETVSGTFRSLGLGRPPAGTSPELTKEALETGAGGSEVRFGGTYADANAVIDALKKRLGPTKDL